MSFGKGINSILAYRFMIIVLYRKFGLPELTAATIIIT